MGSKKKLKEVEKEEEEKDQEKPAEEEEEEVKKEEKGEMVIIEVLKSKLTEEIDFKPRQLTSKAPRKRRARRSTKEIDQNYVSDNQAKESSEG